MNVRARTLVLFLLLVIAGKLAKEGYDWFAYADDRARLTAMRTRLVDAGVEVLRSRARLDTLRTRIQGEDRKLEEERRELNAYGKNSRGGELSMPLYEAYRSDLGRYNEHVGRRNDQFHEWETVLERNHAAVDRYNALADSVRGIAKTLGDPYYPVPTPLEAAAERGVVKVDP
ncbi:MAG: hypothetical protein JO040_09860 [Gemmatimonadetes bacterium]|nr:hypothetical protein [Gemmatimonadota bacterium]